MTSYHIFPFFGPPPQDPADVNSIFGGVVGWNAKMMNKKKALDNLARTLREKSSGRPQY